MCFSPFLVYNQIIGFIQILSKLLEFKIRICCEICQTGLGLLLCWPTTTFINLFQTSFVHLKPCSKGIRIWQRTFIKKSWLWSLGMQRAFVWYRLALINNQHVIRSRNHLWAHRWCIAGRWTPFASSLGHPENCDYSQHFFFFACYFKAFLLRNLDWLFLRVVFITATPIFQCRVWSLRFSATRCRTYTTIHPYLLISISDWFCCPDRNSAPLFDLFFYTYSAHVFSVLWRWKRYL